MTTCARAGAGAWFNYTFLTSKERDNETGLDYFGARYFSSTQGRFTGPDLPFADQHETDPQSWNLYTYVANSPLVLTDPFGLWKQVDCTGALRQCWQAEAGDDWSTLGIDAVLGSGAGTALAEFFVGTQVSEGTIVDVAGFGEWYGSLDPVERMRLQEYEYGPPMGGGLRVVGSAARAGGSLLSRMGSAIGRWFRRGAKSAERTIEIVQREGNLVEMVGRNAQGEIRVLAEMTKQGDTLVLKGLHIEGAGRGTMGVRKGVEKGVRPAILRFSQLTTVDPK